MSTPQSTSAVAELPSLRRRKPLQASVWTVATALALAAADLRAQHTAMELPSRDLATEISDRRGNTVPTDLAFVDEQGRAVKLADYVALGRPVILNLGYYGCPSLCGAVSNGLADGLRELDLGIGVDYEVVTVSIDPAEGPDLARDKKASYIEYLGQAFPDAGAAEQHWHFLTGKAEVSRALADAVGFGYQWNPHAEVWDHSAGIMILSPGGVVSQVLQGFEYPRRTLRLALVEASNGTVGSAWDRILLTCYGYDPTTREYGLAVWTVIRIGGVLTVLGLVTMLTTLWWRERRRQDAVSVPTA